MKRILLAVTVTGVAAGLACAALAAGSIRESSATTMRVLRAPGGDTTKLRLATSVARARPVTFVVTNQ